VYGGAVEHARGIIAYSSTQLSKNGCGSRVLVGSQQERVGDARAVKIDIVEESIHAFARMDPFRELSTRIAKQVAEDVKAAQRGADEAHEIGIAHATDGNVVPKMMKYRARDEREGVIFALSPEGSPQIHPVGVILFEGSKQYGE
jgi:hypothetical protein